jgi:hypothetical protein
MGRRLINVVDKRQTYQSVRDVSSFCGGGGGGGGDGDSGLLLFVDDIVLVSRSFWYNKMVLSIEYRSSDLLVATMHNISPIFIFGICVEIMSPVIKIYHEGNIENNDPAISINSTAKKILSEKSTIRSVAKMLTLSNTVLVKVAL